jgi:hypothetical protein
LASRFYLKLLLTIIVAVVIFNVVMNGKVEPAPGSSGKERATGRGDSTQPVNRQDFSDLEQLSQVSATFELNKKRGKPKGEIPKSQ